MTLRGLKLKGYREKNSWKRWVKEFPGQSKSSLLKNIAIFMVADGRLLREGLSDYNTESLPKVRNGFLKLPHFQHFKDIICRFRKEQEHDSNYSNLFQWQSNVATPYCHIVQVIGCIVLFYVARLSGLSMCFYCLLCLFGIL